MRSIRRSLGSNQFQNSPYFSFTRTLHSILKFMKQTLLSLFILTIFSCTAQFNHIHYKNECNAAYRLSLDSSQYEASNQLLGELKLKYKKMYGEEYALMAYNYSQLGNTSSSAQALKETWSNNIVEMDYLGKIAKLDPKSIMKNYTETDKKLVEEGFENFAKLKGPKFDSLLHVLQIMDSLDQLPRMKVLLTKQDSITNNQLLISTDSLNMIRFKDIVLKIGYPGEWILPGNSLRSFSILIHLADYTSFFYEMNDIFHEEVIKGRMPATYYAAWIDRHNLSLNEPTEYGMLNNKDYAKVSAVERRRIQRKRLELGIVSSFPIPANMVW